MIGRQSFRLHRLTPGSAPEGRLAFALYMLDRIERDLAFGDLDAPVDSECAARYPDEDLRTHGDMLRFGQRQIQTTVAELEVLSQECPLERTTGPLGDWDQLLFGDDPRPGECR
jgi:hypothetical protein